MWNTCERFSTENHSERESFHINVTWPSNTLYSKMILADAHPRKLPQEDLETAMQVMYEIPRVDMNRYYCRIKEALKTLLGA